MTCMGHDGETELIYVVVFGELVSVTRCEVGNANRRAVEMYTTTTIGYPCNVEDWQFGFYTFAFATQDGGDTHVKLDCTVEP